MKKNSLAAFAALLGLTAVASGCNAGGTDAGVANDIRNETMANKTSGPPVSGAQVEKAKEQGANIPAPKP